jgi:hypothetical protein
LSSLKPGLIKRQKIKWRKHRLDKMARELREDSPLREFIYLDEVSVYSLLSSRLGPLASEYTSKQTDSLTGELSGTLGANHLVTAQLGSKLTTAQGSESQVVRKSAVQSTFKDLRDIEDETLLMRSGQPPSDLSKIHNLEDLRNLVGAGALKRFVVTPQDLSRGRLLEIGAELDTDYSYRLSTVITSYIELVDATPDLKSTLDGLGQAEAVGQILDKLLAGLVPVCARAADYRVVQVDNEEWIVHRKIIDRLAHEKLSTFDLSVVGVAEAKLFWKDVRRILFSQSRYTVMCRVSRGVVATAWSPVKLFEVFEEFTPGLAREWEKLQLLAKQGAAQSAVPVLPASHTAARDAARQVLLSYASALATHAGGSSDETLLTDAGFLTEQRYAEFEAVESRRNLLNELTAFIGSTTEAAIDPTRAAELQADALAAHGFTQGGSRFEPTPGPAPAVPQTGGDVRFLDCEFVAIYW